MRTCFWTEEAMMNRKLALVAIGVVALLSLPLICEAGKAKTAATNSTGEASEKLVVLWTSGDRDVALKTVFMYVYNAKRFGWWEDITLIVWGPSSKLASEDKEIQVQVTRMVAEAVVIKACKACADQYGVSPKLEALGIEVKYMGEELTQYIKSGTHVMTF